MAERWLNGRCRSHMEHQGNVLSWAHLGIPMLQKALAIDRKCCLSVLLGSKSQDKWIQVDGIQIRNSESTTYDKRINSTQSITTPLIHIDTSDASQHPPSPIDPSHKYCPLPSARWATQPPPPDRAAARRASPRPLRRRAVPRPWPSRWPRCSGGRSQRDRPPGMGGVQERATCRLHKTLPYSSML